MRILSSFEEIGAFVNEVGNLAGSIVPSRYRFHNVV